MPGLLVLLGCSGGMNVGPASEPPVPAGAASVEGVSDTAPAPGFYTTSQADRGRRHFREVCNECHFASEFRGRDFEWRWRRQTVWSLWGEITLTMPEDDPGSLDAATYVDIIAYILALNEYPAGDVELTAGRDALEAVPLGPNALQSRHQESR